MTKGSRYTQKYLKTKVAAAPLPSSLLPLALDIADASQRKRRGGGIRNAADADAAADATARIGPLGPDLSMECLIRVSPASYRDVAQVSRGCRALVRGGRISRLRRELGLAEHWVFVSSVVLEWDAYDPRSGDGLHVPAMPDHGCLRSCDKESLAVGTELLVFCMGHHVFKYSILTNRWEPGLVMNTPRCMFGSASLGAIAIAAGGCFVPEVHNGAPEPPLSSAEMYDSETNRWTELPSMNRSRKGCAGFFMDGKFYVIGGVSTDNQVLSCGEEYDLDHGTWTVIPDMSAGLNGVRTSPPLVAVVKDELYSADFTEMVVKKYNKTSRQWVTLGGLPEGLSSRQGWGMAFRACGDQLIVIGGPQALVGGQIELNSWAPSGDGPPEWRMIGRLDSGNFVMNCAVMSC